MLAMLVSVRNLNALLALKGETADCISDCLQEAMVAQ